MLITALTSKQQQQLLLLLLLISSFISSYNICMASMEEITIITGVKTKQQRGRWLQDNANANTNNSNANANARQCTSHRSFNSTYNNDPKVPTHYGIMFEASSLYADIEILTMELDIRYDLVNTTTLSVQVYTYLGSYIDVYDQPAAWDLLVDTTLIQVPDLTGAIIPRDKFAPIVITANARRSFYITIQEGPYIDNTVHALQHSGDIHVKGNDIQLFVGSGFDIPGTFPGKPSTIVDPMFAGVIHYRKAFQCDDNKASITNIVYPFLLKEDIKDTNSPILQRVGTTIDNALTDLFNDDEILQEFVTLYDVKPNGPTEPQLSKYGFTCPQEWGDFCPSNYINSKLMFMHQDGLKTGVLQYYLYRKTQSIREELARQYKDAQYLGLVSAAATFEVELTGVPTNTYMDEVQKDYFASVTAHLLNQAASNNIAVFHVTVEGEEFKNDNRMMRVKTRQLSGGQSTTIVSGVILGAVSTGIDKETFRKNIEIVFNTNRDLYITLLTKSGIRPGDINTNGRFTYFSNITTVTGVAPTLIDNDKETYESTGFFNKKTIGIIVFTVVGIILVSLGTYLLFRQRKSNMKHENEDEYREEMREQRRIWHEEKAQRKATASERDYDNDDEDADGNIFRTDSSSESNCSPNNNDEESHDNDDYDYEKQQRENDNKLQSEVADIFTNSDNHNEGLEIQHDDMDDEGSQNNNDEKEEQMSKESSPKIGPNFIQPPKTPDGRPMMTRKQTPNSSRPPPKTPDGSSRLMDRRQQQQYSNSSNPPKTPDGTGGPIMDGRSFRTPRRLPSAPMIGDDSPANNNNNNPRTPNPRTPDKRRTPPRVASFQTPRKGNFSPNPAGANAASPAPRRGVRPCKSSPSLDTFMINKQPSQQQMTPSDSKSVKTMSALPNRRNNNGTPARISSSRSVQGANNRTTTNNNPRSPIKTAKSNEASSNPSLSSFMNKNATKQNQGNKSSSGRSVQTYSAGAASRPGSRPLTANARSRSSVGQAEQIQIPPPLTKRAKSLGDEPINKPPPGSPRRKMHPASSSPNLTSIPNNARMTPKGTSKPKLVAASPRKSPSKNRSDYGAYTVGTYAGIQEE